MKRFITNCLLFLLLFLGAFIIFHFTLEVQKKKIMRLPENVTKAFIGNSTIRYSVNDTIVKNSFNFARSTESLENVFAKLKLLHENNPQLDTIYLGFEDFLIYNSMFHSENTHPFFISEFSFDDIYHNFTTSNFKKNLFFYHAYDFAKIAPILKSYFDSVAVSDLNVGSAGSLRRKKLKEDIELYEKDSTYFRLQGSPPEINLYYLDKFVKYCKDENLNLVFLSPPKHSYIWNNDYYRKLKEERYPDIPLMDFMELELSDDCYGDCRHLNYMGSAIFSNLLEKTIEENKQVQKTVTNNDYPKQN